VCLTLGFHGMFTGGEAGGKPELRGRGRWYCRWEYSSFFPLSYCKIVEKRVFVRGIRRQKGVDVETRRDETKRVECSGVDRGERKRRGLVMRVGAGASEQYIAVVYYRSTVGVLLWMTRGIFRNRSRSRSLVVFLSGDGNRWGHNR